LPAGGERVVALRVDSARTRAAHDIFDVTAADADIAQLMIRELRQLNFSKIFLRGIISTPCPDAPRRLEVNRR
jgi:hypothetical protein